MGKLCKAESCTKQARYGAICSMHSHRKKNWGQLTTRGPAELLAARVEVNSDTGCWEWASTIGAGGYGVFKYDYQPWKAHRLSYTVFKGPIPDGLCVCHHCDNRRCINPAHLFVGTQKENIADMDAKGRRGSSRGESHARSKLTEDDVLDIIVRLRDGALQQEIGDMFDVTQAAIQSINRGRSWGHLTGASPETPIRPGRAFRKEDCVQ